MTNETKTSNRNLNRTPLEGCSLAIKDQSVMQRITAIGWDVDEVSGCMIWRGRKDRDGYGVLSVGATVHEARVHRLVFELNHPGRLMGDDVVRHLTCDTSGCGNDDHLAPGSQHDNILDTMRAGRHFSQTPEGRRRKQVTAIRREVEKAAPARWVALSAA